MKQLLTTFFFLSISFTAFAQVEENIDAQKVTFHHPTLRQNSDPTYLYRADEGTDNTKLRLRLGDEHSGSLEIGYTHYNDGLWYSTFSVNNSGDGYFRRHLAIKGNLKAKTMLIDKSNRISDWNNIWQSGFLKVVMERTRLKEDGSGVLILIIVVIMQIIDIMGN